MTTQTGLDYRGHDLRRTFGTLVAEVSGDELLGMRLLRDRVQGVNDRYIIRDLSGLLARYSPLRVIQGDSLTPDGRLPALNGAGGEGETRTPTPCGT